MTSTKRVLIVQPYVPTYRVPFFEALDRTFADHGISMKVAAPAARGSQAQRGDAARAHPWMVPTTARHAEILGVGFDYYGSRRLRTPPTSRWCRPRRRAWTSSTPLPRGADHVRGSPGVTSRPTSRSPTPSIRDREGLLRRASAVFAYTESGARQALDWGVDPQRVVSLGNTVDTSGLLAAAAAITDQEADDFITALGWEGCEVLGFLGALDDSKGIPFLVELLDHLHTNQPHVRFLIGGRGDSEELLSPAVERGQVKLLGYAGDSEKAMMGAVCRSLVFTGRVGLAAVEAIALGLPVITAREFDHAPEVEYLVEGRDLMYASATVAGFGEAIRAAQVLPRRTSPAVPALADMVEAFVEGCVTALASAARQRPHR